MMSRGGSFTRDLRFVIGDFPPLALASRRAFNYRFVVAAVSRASANASLSSFDASSRSAFSSQPALLRSVSHHRNANRERSLPLRKSLRFARCRALFDLQINISG